MFAKIAPLMQMFFIPKVIKKSYSSGNPKHESIGRRFVSLKYFVRPVWNVSCRCRKPVEKWNLLKKSIYKLELKSNRYFHSTGILSRVLISWLLMLSKNFRNTCNLSKRANSFCFCHARVGPKKLTVIEISDQYISYKFARYPCGSRER